MSIMSKAADYILGVLVENEEVKQFSKDFVSASVQWIGSWFLEDDPTSAKILTNPEKSEATKRDIIETKLEDLKDKPDFMQQLEERLLLFESERKRVKNLVSRAKIDVAGSAHIGDKGPAAADTYDEKNIIRDSEIKTGGDFRLGDDHG